jgi:hypothetical protein
MHVLVHTLSSWRSIFLCFLHSAVLEANQLLVVQLLTILPNKEKEKKLKYQYIRGFVQSRVIK